MILEVWLSRFSKNGYAKRPYRGSPTVVVPENMKAMYRAAARNRYAIEEIGFLLRDLVRIVDAGGGRRELLAYLRKEMM